MSSPNIFLRMNLLFSAATSALPHELQTKQVIAYILTTHFILDTATV